MKLKRAIVIFAAATLVCSAFFSACHKQSGTGDASALEAAYEKAVELGYSGSLDDFISEIRGKDGIDGTDGKNGANGADGKGILSVGLNAQNELIVEYTDGTSTNLGNVFVCRHAYSAWETACEPACASIGYRTRTCEKCGDTDYDFLQATGHDWGKTQTVFYADCTENGLTLSVCKTCGESNAEIIEKYGHLYEQGYCIYCGAMEEAKFMFSLNDDNAYSVRVHPDTRDYYCGEIVIPETHEGLPVTEIQRGGVANCKYVTGFTFPKTITQFNEQYGNNVPTLSRGQANLVKLTVAEGNPKYHSANNCIIATASKTLIWGCAASIIPSDGSVTAIEHGAFAQTKLQKIVIPEGVTLIEANAFAQNSELSEITLPDSLRYIGAYAFNQTAYVQDPANWEDGALYINRHLVATNAGICPEPLAIKEGTLTIAHTAIHNLKSVVIPQSLISIAEVNEYTSVSLQSVVFRAPENWQRTNKNGETSPVSAEELSDPARAAELLTEAVNFKCYVWTKTTDI